MAVNKQRRGKCRTKGCKNQWQCRELCNPCLRNFYELVRAGEITEEEAVKRGIIAPIQRSGRKKSNRLSAALGLK
jgi:hypothetical protein